MFNAKYEITESNGKFYTSFEVSGFGSVEHPFSIFNIDAYRHEYESAKEAQSFTALDCAFRGTLFELACSYAREDINLEQYAQATRFLLNQDIRNHKIVVL